MNLSQFALINMIIKAVFAISIIAIPIFGLGLPLSSGIQLKNNFLEKPLTTTFPKQTPIDCARQNQQLKDFVKDIFKKLGIIANASLTNYKPKRNYPKINEKLEKEMFQKRKPMITGRYLFSPGRIQFALEKMKPRNIDCSGQNHQLKKFAKELLKGKAIPSNPFKFILKYDSFLYLEQRQTKHG